MCEPLDAAWQPIEPVWTGSLSTCDPGEPDETFSLAAVDRINHVRALADLPPIRPLASDDALACAVLMNANGQIAHEPPPDWSCFTQDAGETAARSLLANYGGIEVVGGLLVDPGNDSTLGHRRWLLSRWLTEAGVGTTGDFACVDLGYTIVDTDGWTAWPPPGDTPTALLAFYTFDVDTVGWSIQSETIDFGDAVVHLSIDGDEEELPTTVLTPGIGSRYGLGFRPTRPVLPGQRWTVRITGIGDEIVYSGRKVDCMEDAP